MPEPQLEYRCRKCSRVAGHQETVNTPEPMCCGVAMVPCTIHGDFSKPGLRVDVVQRTAGTPQHRPYWLETWEVWFLWPGRDGTAAGDSEQIGWCGRMLGGTWEWVTMPGMSPPDGVAMNRTMAIEEILNAAAAGLGL